MSRTEATISFKEVAQEKTVGIEGNHPLSQPLSKAWSCFEGVHPISFLEKTAILAFLPCVTFIVSIHPTPKWFVPTEEPFVLSVDWVGRGYDGVGVEGGELRTGLEWPVGVV